MVVDVRIEGVGSAAEPGFASMVALHQADCAERDPSDPVPSASYIGQELFGRPPDRTRLVWVATVDGDPAGYAFATYRTALGQHRVAEIELFVAARLRHRGVATALLRRVVPELIDRGLGSVLIYRCSDVTPEAATAMCHRLGMTERQQERCSRVRVEDIDEALLAGWEAAAVDRAPGYRIEQWTGPVPEEWLAAWCSAAAAMADAPLDDVEYDTETRRPDEQRAADAALAAQGFIAYCTLALGPGGAPAGMTQLLIHRERPEIGHQGDTAVLVGHRGHGIGRWLKAANYRQVSAAQPDLQVVETYNAESNPWMLDINVAMGFRPHHRYDAYQAPIGTVAAALGLAYPSSSGGG